MLWKRQLSPVRVATSATDLIQLGCEMSGFLRPDEDLLWYKGHQLLVPTNRDDSRYSVAIKDGTLGAGQVGRNETVHSRLFILSIRQPKNGVYTCKVRGTNAEGNILMTVNTEPPEKGEH